MWSGLLHEVVRASQQWKLIAESIPLFVWLSRPDGATSVVNTLASEYTGIAVDEHKQWDWTTVVHPADVPRAVNAWNYAVRTGSAFESDYRLRRVDGTYRWHTCRALPFRDADGEIARWIGTATDIEQHKRLEVGLVDAKVEAIESASRISAMEAAAPLGFVYLDLDQRVVTVNEEFAEIVGIAQTEQVGMAVGQIVPDLWSQIEPAYAKVVASGCTVRNACMIGGTADDPGRFHEWLVSCYPVRDKDALAGVGVVVVDVTERVQAEEFRSAVMSQVADGVYTQDEHGHLTSMNRAACRMLGWTEAELKGQNIHEVIHFQNADHSQVPSAECALLTGGNEGRLSRSVGEAFTRKDGSVFPVAYSSVPLRIGDQTDAVAVVFRDISEPGTSPNVIRLLIVDNHAMTSEAFQLLLSRQEGVEVVGSAATSAMALREVARLAPEVVLINYALPDLDGISTTARIRAEFPEVSVILMTDTYDDGLVAEAVAAGCAGVLDKDHAWVELVGAVRAAYHGQTTITQDDLQRLVPRPGVGRNRSRISYLTDREREVLTCMTRGLTSAAVAKELSITPNTVRNHVQRILYKLNVHSRMEAVVVATNEPWA